MKSTGWIAGAAMLLACLPGAAAEVEFDIDGAAPGRWTMDLDAAKKLAAEKQLPILLDFSGSDWCGWCRIMEENVFTQPAWKTYAQENLVMVFIDFPKDKSRVPDKYTERNNALKNTYAIEGYPTFVVLDSDGETELGRLGSGRSKTPESFQAELEALFRFRPAELALYTESLTTEAAQAYRALINDLTGQKQALKEGEKAVAEAQNKVSELQKDIRKTEQDMMDFRVAQLSDEKRSEFEQLQADLAEARKKLTEWINTDPEKSDENMEKYKAMQSEIQALEQKIAQY
jgi:thiol-disulfide isomerase/thioredoxin